MLRLCTCDRYHCTDGSPSSLLLYCMYTVDIVLGGMNSMRIQTTLVLRGAAATLQHFEMTLI